MGIFRRTLQLVCAMLVVVGTGLTADDEHSGHASGGELKQGRYIGHIELEPTHDKIAVVTDFYLESPEDLTLFPSLHVALKLTFGGYNTHEYITETFDDIRYDFDNGVLALDDPQNDLVITAEVHNMGGNTFIMGDVFIRSSAVFGKISLKFETDEPPDEEAVSVDPSHDSDEPGADQGNFIPLLDGQYEGLCNSEKSVLQIQTVRGLKTIWQAEDEASSLSRYYGISARIGVRDEVLCGKLGPNGWCSYNTYGGGSYNAYLGKLTLKGPSATDECTVRNGVIKCEVRRAGWNRSCEFKRTTTKHNDPKFFVRRFNLRPTATQLKDLPPPNPPKNTDLSNALRGTFTGYLHNETNDRYQLIRLNVMPFSYTDNPHNPNQLAISSTATLHLGKDISGPFITQRYELRSFYIRPGFTLAGPSTDSFITITEWKAGFIRGVLSSHAFGRVGTVQLLKGNIPEPPTGTELVRSYVGEYTGPTETVGISALSRWFRFVFPAQPNDLTDNLIRISGSYVSVVDATRIRNIERGTFDPFTGALGWILEREGAATFVSGFIDKNDRMKMYWPPAPHAFGAQLANYEYETFTRK